MAKASTTAKDAGKAASAIERRFARVVDAFSRDPLVTREQTRGFGSGALKVNGKIFAMITSKGQFVVKLPKARVADLIRSGSAARFEPRPGRAMKEWVSATPGRVPWLALAREAYSFVKAR